MNPFKDKARASGKSKLGNLLARGGPAKCDKAMGGGMKRMMAHEMEEEMPMHGRKSGGRLDKYARGGRTKGKTTVNIVIAGGSPEAQPPPAPVTAGVPPAPPPPPPAPRPAPPPGAAAGPMMSAPMMPMGAPPPAPAPQLPPNPLLPRAAGGRTPKYIPGDSSSSSLKRWARYARQNSYQKGGKVKLTAGADTGKGRLQIAHHEKAK